MTQEKKTTATSPSNERATGCVKWFNGKNGYGFLTVTSEERNGNDIFVHHSALQVSDNQYKYLVQGEHVEFEWCQTESNEHEWQAGNVSGINRGRLMCETRNEQRNDRNTYHTNKRSSSNYRGGSGPREGDEWMLVRRKPNSRNQNHENHQNNE